MHRARWSVYTPYTPSIMPLVLYDLLVISLSYRDQPDQSPVVGNWDTDFGTWAAHSDPSTGVYGYYRDEATGLRGMIRGTMKGIVLTGTWDQTEYHGRTGTLRFEFKDNFTKFEGKWNYGNADPDPKKHWNGTKR